MKKAFFIMIFTLQAALFGAAQEVVVVNEGAKKTFFVDNHPGSNYIWRVLIGFSPDTEANPDTYDFTTTNKLHEVEVQWHKTGIFYLDVFETDVGGCVNRKVIPVNVVAGNQSIAFVSITGSVCYNQDGNGFNLPLQIFGNNGLPPEDSYFPVTVRFTLNGTEYFQEVVFNNQVLEIQDSWLKVEPTQNNMFTVQILEAKNHDGQNISPLNGRDIHAHTVFMQPFVKFVSADDLVNQFNSGFYKLQITTGNAENATWHWEVDPPDGTSANVSLIDTGSAEILWDGPPGFYTVKVKITDGNDCVSDFASQIVEVRKPASFAVFAGPDTTIGSCQSYVFTDVYPADENFKYQWEPARYLSDPTVPNPVFTTGKTTTYILTVTNAEGIDEKDTVTVSVSEMVADAGEDIYMLPNTTTILNGLSSIGENLKYRWSTLSGKIESGENTANPLVSGFGTYYLEITDKYGCTDNDSVIVVMITQAPVAVDDYDTTKYQREVIIDVLANDTGEGNNINPSSLSISNPPFNGTAYVDFDNYLVHYRPNNGFTGTDDFEYSICNSLNQCDKANVYVLVTDFKFMIPNAFSPNGDGINDYFEIVGIENYEKNSIMIINRWGNKVYEAKGYGISTSPAFWDGKSNTGYSVGNQELPTGTYYYILDLGNGENPISGSIYLDR